MGAFDTTVQILEWYGENNGGVLLKEKKSKKKFKHVYDALRWAYSEVDKYRDEVKNQHTPALRCIVRLAEGGFTYQVFLVKGKMRVYWWSKDAMSRGFLLNKDGSINFRGGGIE